MISNIAFLALFLFIYSLMSGRMEKTLVSGALLFIAVGWSVGPMGLDIFSFAIDNEGLRLLAELTLAVVLFTDAAHSRLNILKKSHTLPERLLLVGLPFTFLLGWGGRFCYFPTLL